MGRAHSFKHVQIFNKMKSIGATDWKFQIHEPVTACDLEHKHYAKSKTLSGGQKRELRLAMIFTGGSRVCCVDEASSGLTRYHIGTSCLQNEA